MKRRDFMRLVGGVACTWPCAVSAQTPNRTYRVGSLNIGQPVTADSRPGIAITRRLAEHGYAIGRNLVFESRGAEMDKDQLPRLVEELVAKLARPTPSSHLVSLQA